MSFVEMIEYSFQMVIERRDQIMEAIQQHLFISLVSMLIAAVIAVPLGIALTRFKKLADPIIAIASVFQTIPSIAMLGFLLPFVGIGEPPAIICLVLYALLPILRNTYTGILGVDPSVVDAGKGMGMTSWQILYMIELPASLPVMMAGVRNATVLTIGVTAVAAFIGAGGLGDLIFRGVQTMRNDLILLGAIPAALLAIFFDQLLKWVEIWATPRALRKEKGVVKKMRKAKKLKSWEAQNTAKEI